VNQIYRFHAGKEKTIKGKQVPELCIVVDQKREITVQVRERETRMWGLTSSGKERNYRVWMAGVYEEGEAGVEEGVAAFAATLVLQTLMDVE
jgi:hypothetical protein